MTRVIKLGGSLLDLDDLAARFRRWLASQPTIPSVMLAGGGEMADVVRAAFARHLLDEEAAHWLCVRVLGVTAQWLAHLFPEAIHATRFEALPRGAGHPPAGLWIFDCEHFLRTVDACSPAPLPCSWDVTSDSIAARLADRLGAAELVLLKSDLPGVKCTFGQAAEAGYVDRYFPAAALPIASVRCVNLRAAEFPEAPLLAGR